MQNTRVKLIVHNRKLLGQFDGATVEFSPEALLARTEPLAILGEAGIGKSELLTALSGSEDCKLVSAARLAGSRDPRALVGLARLVLIDGLDEAAGAKDGEAVDKVLSALDAAGSPRFILACRVADWRSATATQRIADIYGTSPLELHLTPLTRDQIHEVLTVAVGGERATEIVDHFETRRLSELLGNPQTLDMITSLPGQIALPESSLDLFEQYVGLTWHEHSAMKPDTPLRKAGREKVLDALGAAFAAQILTGTSALSRRPPDPNGEDDLSLADVAALPGAEPIEDFLDSRLVLTLSVDRFTYLHRRIGEYLGARWLAGHADTRRKRKRLLAMLSRLLQKS